MTTNRLDAHDLPPMPRSAIVVICLSLAMAAYGAITLTQWSTPASPTAAEAKAGTAKTDAAEVVRESDPVWPVSGVTVP